jgi:hypothetical protein
MRQFILAIFLILSPAILLATTIHVPADQPTIQAGIDAASAGDTVLVACGTYYEHDIEIDEAIVLSSETGSPECTTIDAHQMGRCISIDGVVGSIHVKGFTLTGGQAEGEYPDDKGGALFCQNSSPMISDCIIGDNYAGDDGGGLFFTGHNSTVPLIENCSLIRNVALDFGGAILATQSASPIVSNVTMYGNAASLGGGIYCNNNSTPQVQNCIIAFSAMGEAVHCEDGTSITFECCDVFGNESGDWTGCIADQLGITGNISADPLFCDPNSGNLSLYIDSPCALENNDCGVLIGAMPIGCGPTCLEYEDYYPNPAPFISSFETGFLLKGAWAIDSYVLQAASGFGLYVFDVSNPYSPLIIGELGGMSGDVYDVVVQDSYAFLTDTGTGLQIVDISQLSDPVLVSTLDTPGRAHKVAVSGNIAFIAVVEGGLQIADFSDISSPVILGEVPTQSETYGIDVSGTIALMADAYAGVHVVDVSDPTSPVILTTLETPGGTHDVQIREGIAFIACFGTQSGDGSLVIADIHDPNDPEIISTTYTGGEPWSVTLDDGFAYISDHDLGLLVADIRDLKEPIIIGKVDIPVLYRLAISDEFVGAGGNTTRLFHTIWKQCPYETTVDGDQLESPPPNIAVFPNPFNPHLTITFSIPSEAHGSLTVHDVSGRKIRVLKDGRFIQGANEIVWNGQDDHGQDVASGVYFVRLVTGEHQESKKVVLLR